MSEKYIPIFQDYDIPVASGKILMTIKGTLSEDITCLFNPNVLIETISFRDLKTVVNNINILYLINKCKNNDKLDKLPLSNLYNKISNEMIIRDYYILTSKYDLIFEPSEAKQYRKLIDLDCKSNLTYNIDKFVNYLLNTNTENTKKEFNSYIDLLIKVNF